MVAEKLGRSLNDEAVHFTIIADTTIGEEGQYETGSRLVYFDDFRYVHSSDSAAYLVEDSDGDEEIAYWLIWPATIGAGVIALVTIAYVIRRKRKA